MSGSTGPAANGASASGLSFGNHAGGIDPSTLTFAYLSTLGAPSHDAPPVAAGASSFGSSTAPTPPLFEPPTAPLQLPSSQLPTLVGGDLMAQSSMPVSPGQADSVVNSSGAGPTAALDVATARRDPVQAAPVPEPSTLALLLAVSIGVGVRAAVRRGRVG